MYNLFQPAKRGQCKPQCNPLIPEPPRIPPTREPLGLASYQQPLAWVPGSAKR